MLVKKNLFIVRHGHAKFGSGIDFDRQLKDKGIVAVQHTADFIDQQCQKYKFKVGLCISSASQRTKQTADILSKQITLTNLDYDKDLYSTNASHWLEKINSTTKENIIIVGHNPTLSQLVNRLCGLNLYMKPAHCAFIALEIKPDGFIYPATLIDYHRNE